MTRISKSLLRSSLIAAILSSAVALAQDQPPTPPPTPPSNGGWRPVGSAPPVSPQAAPPAAPQQTDPTEPVDRSGSYGQPAQSAPPQTEPPQAVPPPNMPPQSMAPQTTPQAATRPPYGLPAQVTIKPGTFFTVRINQGLASNHNKAGDLFTATLTQPIIANGIVVAQRGQTVAGVVQEVGKDKDGKRFIRLSVTSITAADGTQVPVQTTLSSMQGRTTPGGIEAGTVVATTAVGAAVGGAAAWGTGAAVGAGAGALVGLAAVVATHNHPAVIYPETALTFQATQAATISTTNAPQAFRFAGPQDYQQNQPMMMRGQAGPYPGASYMYGPGYAYPPAYYYPGYYYPYLYPYPYYWGPGFGVVIGRGFRRW
jgi:hypothetical protein